MRTSAALLLVGLIGGLATGSGPATPAIAARQEPPVGRFSWSDPAGHLGTGERVRSANCASTTISARQQLHVKGRMLPAGAEPGTGVQGGQLGRTRNLGSYRWASPDPGNIAAQGFVLGATWEQEAPVDGYLVIEFFRRQRRPRSPGRRSVPTRTRACP